MSGIKPTGRHQEKRLTPAGARNLGPGFHADGQGLYLKVDASGARRWVQRIVIQGKRRDVGLGSAALVTLGEAREAALQQRKLARAGYDPLAAKQRSKAIPSFEEAARQVHAHNEGGWRNEKHRKQWLSTMEAYVFPHIGARKVGAVSSADILLALDPIWTRRSETARRVKQRIGTVLKWAIARGYRTDNPADVVQQALLKHDRSNVKRMTALHHSEVPKAIATVNASKAFTATKLAFSFLVHTACRSGEVRGALWSEIDIERLVWVVPAERMKAKKAHRVPLTPAVLRILERAKALRREDADLVFPSARGTTLSDMTLSKLMRELGIAAVPHGFRSSFRDWAGDETGHPREVIEFALAHGIKDKAEAAYARSDLFEKRRVLMSDWSDFLDTATK
ncbi:tyrosine-type recombinase/integrase [Sphingomonas sp. CFBP 13720]|uniref:tyrosine-type recombinase/integrase n=1 Tax=Sphingomonas sp. CFBP 13720 TaxID=2775302 RepID=UPI00177E3755|nr:site-specific integrase [Sphingomonas sp. CFBP 13720]MBD8678315.1 tyrosine-type recombinase/integrase [Sphingomonas sp. CFBP 13720]